MHNNVIVNVSIQVKTPKWLSECLRNVLRESKFPKLSGGACPQTPLGGLIQRYGTRKVREIINYTEVKTGSKNGALQGRRTAVIVEAFSSRLTGF